MDRGLMHKIHEEKLRGDVSLGECVKKRRGGDNMDDEQFGVRGGLGKKGSNTCMKMNVGEQEVDEMESEQCMAPGDLCREVSSTCMKMKITQYGSTKGIITPQDGINNCQDQNTDVRFADTASFNSYKQPDKASSAQVQNEHPATFDKENKANHTHLTATDTRRTINHASSSLEIERERLERELLSLNVRKGRNLRMERRSKNTPLTAVDRLTRPRAGEMMRKHRITQPMKKYKVA